MSVILRSRRVVTLDGIRAASVHLSGGVIARVHKAVVKGLRQPEFQSKLADLGFEQVGNTPEEFATYIRTEIEKWGRVVKASGAKAAL
jgi:tripartite-type tricarboxylate transporter receptor subunit TctC